MQAAFLVGKQKFDLREVPDPAVPEDGLVMRVEACGVCGSDLRRWREGPPPQAEGGITPGHEVAGVVEEVGSGLKRYAPGDRLAIAPDIHCGHCYYCRRGRYNLCDDLRLVGITPGYPGGFAEKLVLTGEILAGGIVHPMPPGLSFAEGALAETLSSVLAAHHQAKTGLDDAVLVIGAGPIGCLHVAVARAQGAFVIVSEPSEQRRRVVERFGPDAVLDPMATEVAAETRRLTGGLGATMAICANPIAATQAQAVEAVRKGGRVVLFGGLPKANPMTTLDGNRIHYGEIEVVGAFSYHPSMHELALNLLARRLIPASQLVTHTMPLADIGTAFETANSGQGLKVIVEP